MSKAAKAIIAVIVAIALGIGLYFLLTTMIKDNKKLTTSEFMTYVKNGEREDIVDSEKFKRVYIDGYTIYGSFSDKKTNSGSYDHWAYISNMHTVDGFEKLEDWLDHYNVQYDYSNPNAGSGWGNVVYIGILIVAGVLLIITMRAASGGGGKVMNFGKTKARVSTNLKVRFSDVAGAEEEKEELKEVVEFLRSPKKFSNLGAKIPKGVLLVGPPGTGKTLFAKAVAGEAGVPFFSVSGSDFVEMYVGVGASRVRDLFDMAKRNQPCIIFIDEIDAVGRQRGAGLGGGHDEREQTLNQILVQMDGFETNEGVIVMAATNRADILDDALLRPGRFDRQIYVNLPDVKGREQILKVHARNKPLAPEVNFKIIARMTSGFSGADLANLLNEAAILAARANKTMIGNHELYEGINKVIMGPQKKSRVVTEADKKCTAYHEAGHAILAKLCEKNENVHEVSIIPRGMAGGYTLTRPENDDTDYTVKKLNDMICMLLGGRVAEEIVIQDISAGASSDIKKVSQIARKMVTEWGMSEKLGPIVYASDGPVFIGRDFEERATYSEETAAIIDEEVKSIVSSAYQRAKKLLLENRSILDNMARTLVECETIYTHEVDMLMQGASYIDVLQYMEEHDKGKPDMPFGEKGMSTAEPAAPAPQLPEKTEEPAKPEEPEKTEETVKPEEPEKTEETAKPEESEKSEEPEKDDGGQDSAKVEEEQKESAEAADSGKTDDDKE